MYDDDFHRFYINNLEANVLVDTSCLENNIEREDVKIIEVDFDPKTNYEK